MSTEKNILIQQKFNKFIGKGANYYTGKEKNNYAKGFNCKISRLVQGAVIKITNLTIQFNGRNRRIRLQ